MSKTIILTLILLSVSAPSFAERTEYNLNVGDIDAKYYGTNSVNAYQNRMKDMDEVSLESHDLRIQVRDYVEDFGDGSENWNTAIDIILDDKVIATTIKEGHSHRINYYKSYAKQLNQRIEEAKNRRSKE